MNKVYILLPLLLVFACTNNHNYKEQGHASHEEHNHSIVDEPKEHHGHHHAEGKHEDANAHMHKSSFKDLVKRFESAERDEYQQPQKVLAYLDDVKGKTIMDIGAGTGYFSVKLAAQGANVIAADVDDRFLEYMKNRIQENNIRGIETRKIPYDAPGLDKQEVDKVIIVNTYHHIENRASYFAKVKEGTKADGELIIIDFFKYKLPIGPSVGHKISMDVVVNELKQAGYKDFEVNVDLLKYQYIIKAK